jgi:hypothetical protein
MNTFGGKVNFSSFTKIPIAILTDAVMLLQP